MMISRPQIWTPFSDRCPDCNRRRRQRRFNPLRMAVGDRLLDASGNRILDADGNVMLDDGAGNDCCCAGVPCSLCPDAAPKRYVVTFADVALYNVGGCYTCTGPLFSSSLRLDAPSSTFAGTWTLNQVAGNPCKWTAEITGYRWRRWDGTSCTGTPGIDSTIFQIRLIRTSGQFTLEVWDQADVFLFRQTISATNCKGTLNFTNSFTTTPQCFDYVWGKDGTATVTG